MSTPTAPVLEERPESDAIAWGWLVPLLWVLRRPLLGLTATLLRLAAALVMPALVILGAMKLWQVAANRLEKPEDASDPYPGDDETLNERAAELAP